MKKLNVHDFLKSFVFLSVGSTAVFYLYGVHEFVIYLVAFVAGMFFQADVTIPEFFEFLYEDIKYHIKDRQCRWNGHVRKIYEFEGCVLPNYEYCPICDGYFRK